MHFRAKVGSARWFMRFLADGMLQRLVAQAHGSVFDTITTSTFELACRSRRRHDSSRDSRSSVDFPLTSVRLSHSESQTLAILRDALLPKLLSGELRVRDAEKAVEQVA